MFSVQLIGGLLCSSLGLLQTVAAQARRNLDCASSNAEVAAHEAHRNLDCANNAELVDNLLFLNATCSDEGEIFAEPYQLIPGAISTPKCAEVARRVQTSCSELFGGSPIWFAQWKNALDAAVGSAPNSLWDLENAPMTHFVSDGDSDARHLRACGGVLEDGLERCDMPAGQDTVIIDAGSAGAKVRLDFTELELDHKSGDSIRFFDDIGRHDERLDEQLDSSAVLPIAPIVSSGSVLVVRLISRGGSGSRTSFRAVISCVCDDDSASWQGGGKPVLPSCGPCAASPCQNGGSCRTHTSAVPGDGHRRAQSANCHDRLSTDVHDACGDQAQQSCDAECAKVLQTFRQDCAASLHGSDSAILVAVQTCLDSAQHWWLSEHLLSYGFDCTCLPAWTGARCDVNRCDGVECGEHGACVEGVCVCASGWSGEHCGATPYPESRLISPEHAVIINDWISDVACGGTHPFAEQYQKSAGDVPGDWFCYAHRGDGVGGSNACSYTGSAPTPTPGSWGVGQPACSHGRQFGPNLVWERCFSSFEDDSSTPATFHQRCDPYDVTVSVARNSLGYTFGGFAEHSWGRSTCCAAHPDTCSGDSCIDTTAANNFIFRLAGPGAARNPERFGTTGRSNSYQLSAPTTFPQWGDGGGGHECDSPVSHECGATDLCMGWRGNSDNNPLGRPLSDGTGHCLQGTTYEGDAGSVCGGDANWGETELEVWRLADVDPCAGNPCGAHGTCHVGAPNAGDYYKNSLGDYYCECDSCDKVPFGQCQEGCEGFHNDEGSRNECGGGEGSTCDGSVGGPPNTGCKPSACLQ
eukprot:COSAG04_NODE_2600_length_3870_cov_2.863431_2_plen_808_part_00